MSTDRSPGARPSRTPGISAAGWVPSSGSPAVKAPAEATQGFFMPDSSGIPAPLSGDGNTRSQFRRGERDSALRIWDSGGRRDTSRYRIPDTRCGACIPFSCRNGTWPMPAPPRMARRITTPGYRRGIRHQVLRPGMVRMMHEGFRPYGILLHVGKLAHISFPMSLSGPANHCCRIGFSHDRMCIRCSHYRQDSPTVSVKKACGIHRKVPVRKHGEKSQPLPENSGGGRKPHFS